MIKSLIYSIRPVNALLAAVSAWVGYYFSSGLNTTAHVYYACLAAAFVCAGGNVWNDYFDCTIDQINKPYRPYASGVIPGSTMVLMGVSFLCSGMVLSLFINKQAAIIASAAIVVVMLYNIYVKRVVLLGNILIAVLSGFTFLFGAAAGQGMQYAIIPAVFASLYHLGREVLKDVEDRKGDRQLDINTFPIKYGNKAAVIAANIIFSVVIVATLIPYIFLDYSLLYLLIAVVGVDLLVIVVIFLSWIAQDPPHMHRINNILKIGMIFGLIALLFK